MLRKLFTAAAVAAASLAVATSAFGFDCIRVSSSLQGLQQSTKSGNWLLFDFSSASGVQRTFQTIVGADLPLPVAQCVATKYATYDVKPYFALGVGVAGGKTGSGGVGVLAWHNPNEGVLGNLRGIDHLEASPVGAALFGSLAACGIDVDEE